MPWEDIIGMRHRLVHAYVDINLDILWRTVDEPDSLSNTFLTSSSQSTPPPAH
ncbi:MAG: DUF86 domain-containing protein [Syntrophothermus sp.]